MKKILFTCVFLLLILFICIVPQTAVEAAKSGLLTWFNQIVPALLPFSILSAVLLRSGYMDGLGSYANGLAILLTLVCGFVFGFPIGAKLAADFYSKNLLNREQASLLCICANNFSSMYVGGYVLPTLFPTQDVSIHTYLLLYLFPLLIAIVLFLTPAYRPKKLNRKKTASRFHLDMQIIDAGIISGFESLIKICGYIVLFSLFSQLICKLWPTDSLLGTLLLGNLEITNGIQLLLHAKHLNSETKYRLALQFLSFGGCSGLAQTASILKGAELPMRSYLLGKMILSLCILFLCICFNIYHG